MLNRESSVSEMPSARSPDRRLAIVGAGSIGVAFAVLLMNIAAPTIDLYTQPRVFGARRG